MEEAGKDSTESPCGKRPTIYRAITVDILVFVPGFMPGDSSHYKDKYHQRAIALSAPDVNRRK